MTLAIVGLLHIGALFLLLTTSPEQLRKLAEQPMQLISIRPPPPPAPRPRQPVAAQKSHTSPAAPPPRVIHHAPTHPSPVPVPVVVAAAAETPVSGAGTALGSIGSGVDLGAGGGGGGNSGGVSRHSEWVGGGLSKNDYPEAAKRAGLEGVVDVRFTVLVDGRVKDCRVDHSSGNAQLDQLTCALTEQRLLYNPALDATGKPVEEVAGRRFRFVLDRRRR